MCATVQRRGRARQSRQLCGRPALVKAIERHSQHLKKMHSEIVASDPQLADTESKRRGEAQRSTQVSALCPSCGGALWSIDCVRTPRVSEGSRSIRLIRATIESMPEGLREVRSELYAAQQLQ